jgi:hypothetical protein
MSGTGWPWATDRKNPEKENALKKGNEIVGVLLGKGSSKRKQLVKTQPQKSLKSITGIIRKGNGEINAPVVKQLISDLSRMLQEK